MSDLKTGQARVTGLMVHGNFATWTVEYAGRDGKGGEYRVHGEINRGPAGYQIEPRLNLFERGNSSHDIGYASSSEDRAKWAKERDTKTGRPLEDWQYEHMAKGGHPNTLPDPVAAAIRRFDPMPLVRRLTLPAGDVIKEARVEDRNLNSCQQPFRYEGGLDFHFGVGLKNLFPVEGMDRGCDGTVDEIRTKIPMEGGYDLALMISAPYTFSEGDNSTVSTFGGQLANRFNSVLDPTRLPPTRVGGRLATHHTPPRKE